MNMQSVSSSNIAAVGYDDTTRILRIEFNSGKVYDYENVPKRTFEGLLHATSVGKYFHNNVRDVYSYSGG